MPHDELVYLVRLDRDEAWSPTPGRPAGLAHIGGRRLVEYTLEDLHASGARTVHVAVARYAAEIEDELGDGARWGLKLVYQLTRGHEPDAELLDLVPGAASQALMAHGDWLRTPCATLLLRAAARRRNAARLRATCPEGPVGLDLFRFAGRGPREEVVMPRARVGIPNRPEAYLRLNFAVAAGEFPGIHLRTRCDGEQVSVGRRARLLSSSVTGAPVLVAAGARVDARARLRSSVVGAGSVLERDVELERCVVLSGTWLAPGWRGKDAIVGPGFVWDRSEGEELRLRDCDQLAPTDRATLAERLRDGIHRGVAAMLLVVSLPLWPIAWLSACASSPHRPIARRTWLGNRRTRGPSGQLLRRPFRAWWFRSPARMLGSLPLLLPIVRGDLRWVGVEPLGPLKTDRLREPWERARESLPAGLLGPHRLDLADDERRIAEALLAEDRSLRGDLGWVRASFSPGARSTS